MSFRNLLPTISLMVLGVVLSATSYAADESGEIVCPPRLTSPVQSPAAAMVPPPGSIAEAATAIRNAIYAHDVGTVQRLLTQSNYAQIIEDSTESDIFHLAVSTCRADMVQLFLAHPATILNARDEFGRAPLHIAAASCGRDVMDLLLAHPGADPNILYTELFNLPMGSNEQRAPLHEAARKGNAAAGSPSG